LPASSWEDKRNKLKANLERLDQTCETYIESLDHALILISKVGILYETLPRSEKRELLRNVIERVVVNHEGKLDRLDLLSPFAYLRDVSHQVVSGEDTSKCVTRIETGDISVTRSSRVSESALKKTRTSTP
jgi:hypothetical protein